MADTTIQVILPEPEKTLSVEYAEVADDYVASVTADDTVTIEDALANKNNSLQITVETTADSTAVIKAGNRYPNTILGDLELSLGSGAKYVIILEDISRFETTEGAVVITGVEGTVYAAAKRAGLDPSTANIYNTDKDY